MRRLLGQETEYAIRFSPRAQGKRPSHEEVHKTLVAVLEQRVAVRRGTRWRDNHQIFVENGGAFYYEFFLQARADGLIEGSTPECRGPGQLLLYQRAQEKLLKDALPAVQGELARLGFPGRLALLKNGRDAEGHVYGAQESYEAPVATGWRLALARALLVLLVPFVLAATIFGWLFAFSAALCFVAFLVSASVVGLIIPPLRPWVAELLELRDRGPGPARSLGVVINWASTVLVAPAALPFAWSFRALWFRTERRALTAHLITRVVYTGVGTLMTDGHFWLSERGPSLKTVSRRGGGPKERVIYDSGHFLKALLAPVGLEFAPYASLFRRRQRLQIGYADSNRAQVAEYLKIGTTNLLLDMAQAGLLDGAPQLKRPVEAAQAIAADPSLQTSVSIAGGWSGTALEIQRYYLERARAYVETASVVSIEDREVVRLWSLVLDALDDDPSSLVGRVDWVTKRYLIEASAADASYAAQKKVDLRYHELGTGYFDLLEDAGGAPRLLDEADIAAAVSTPPSDTPAAIRSRIIRDLRYSAEKVYVSWDSVRVGGNIGGKVVRLEDYRS